MKPQGLWCFLVVAALCLLAGIAWSQGSTSRIEGTVVDSTSAVIANASVRVTNEDTGVSYESKTGATGTYTVPSLTPGQYTVRVTREGFEAFTSTHNALSIGAPLVVNITLRVGTTSEVVEVQGSYERMETTNAALSDVMTTQQIKNLPLNGRNPLSLLTLEPGVVQRSTGAIGSGTHVYGSRDRSHNVTIDGIDANESTVPNPQGNIQRLTPDNVLEFRTVTLDPTAEYGRNSGANVMIATKPGTSGFHGDVFYFNRNTAFNANEWFNNFSHQPRPDLKLNQYGFDVGGPVFGKKTFFFGSFQNNDIRQTGSISSALGGAPLVYTGAARSGIFRYFTGCINFVNPGCSPGDPNNITSNSRNLVDLNGNLRVPLCSGSIVTNCVASYNIFGNDPAGIGADSAVMAMI